MPNGAVMNQFTTTAAISFLGVFLAACGNASLQQDDLSLAEQQAINQISDLITDQCRTDGFTPGADAFTECYWNSAADVRDALLDRKERDLLASGALTATDRQANIFRNRDNADRRVWFEATREERAQAAEMRGSRR